MILRPIWTRDSGTIVYQFSPTKNQVGEFATIDKRLREGYNIVGRELAELDSISNPSEDVVRRINKLLTCSCAEAAIQANMASRGGVYRKIGSSVEQLDLDDLLKVGVRHSEHTRVNDFLNNLTEGLSVNSPRAIIYFQPRGRELAGHTINAELINGEIWLYEAIEGLAVPLNRQVVDGITGVEPFTEISSTRKYFTIFTE
jgi:hypothetical protein